MSIKQFCPLKMAGGIAYPRCEGGSCKWYIEGQCAMAVLTKAAKEAAVMLKGGGEE